jgi:hypothetical protein
MKVRYVGPHASVEIAATRQIAENGKTVEVPAEIGRELVKQASWKKVTAKKKAKE